MMIDSDSDFEDTSSVNVRKRKQASTSKTTVSDNNEVERKNVENNDPRRTYLITYATANKTLYPTRESFAKACKTAFGGRKKVSYYACSEELHGNGEPHYHVSINLTKPQRWGAAKKALSENGAIVNFGEPCNRVDGMYAWAYRYVTKCDSQAYHSPGHPSLERIRENFKKIHTASSSQENNRESEARSTSAKEGQVQNTTKRKGLTNADVAEYCRKKNMKTLDELLADAETRRLNGDTTLNSYIFSRSMKSISEVIEVAWRMARAVSKIKNLATPRMDALSSALNQPCLSDCKALWLTCALDILQCNQINKYVFADALRTSIKKGRGKDRNIYIVGPGNSGKTFLLTPLLKNFPETFANPAGSQFSWIGADEASIIILNDYCWHNKGNAGNIDWGQLLNLLEGFECNLPTPMNLFSRHIKIKTDVPIFGTGPSMIQWYATSPNEIRMQKHEQEDRQMSYSWKTFTLSHIFTDVDKIADIPECVSCFAHLAMLGEES